MEKYIYYKQKGSDVIHKTIETEQTIQNAKWCIENGTIQIVNKEGIEKEGNIWK